MTICVSGNTRKVAALHIHSGVIRHDDLLLYVLLNLTIEPGSIVTNPLRVPEIETLFNSRREGNFAQMVPTV